jgi:hypothetical protein
VFLPGLPPLLGLLLRTPLPMLHALLLKLLGGKFL